MNGLAELRAENAELRDELDFERSENGWVREFLDRMAEHCGTKDCPSLVAYVEQLEAENSKLRELAKDMGELLDVLSECDMVCKHYRNGCIDDCYYVNARRKLGMEVDR